MAHIWTAYANLWGAAGAVSLLIVKLINVIEAGALDDTTLLLKAALQAELDKHFFLQSSMVVASRTPSL